MGIQWEGVRAIDTMEVAMETSGPVRILGKNGALGRAELNQSEDVSMQQLGGVSRHR